MNVDIQAIARGARLWLYRKGPKLMIWGGTAGGVAAAVWACKQTRKLDPVLEKHRRRAEAARKAEEADKKKAMTKAYLATALDVGKLYAPPVALGAASVTSILVGNHIFTKRTAALAAAYVAVDGSFRKYREGVVEKYGEDVDRELKLGIRQEKIETTETDEKGREKKVKKTVNRVNHASEYARIFAYGESTAAEQNADYNRFYIDNILRTVNSELRAHGYVFLNHVYELLGFEATAAGQVVGWVYDKHADEGDNTIDFNITEIISSDGQVGYLLDFNVDGPIVEHALQLGLMTNM